MPLTEAAWRQAVARLAAAEAPAAASGTDAPEPRLDPAAWLAGIFALAGAERPEPARAADIVRGPDFRALVRAPADPAAIRSAA